MKKADMLFLERHCPECGPVKAALDMHSVESDDFRGRDGQELYVFSSQSPAASMVLLDAFNVKVSMPLILTHKGEIVNSPKKIVEYLEKQRMAV